ncbi:MAG: N-acetylmuramoyl-L-alanine amidase [Alloprevotella sp.]|nr:N-acetylmuramoyl-L-alanine amidase [Alloprevotella sp.]
MRYKIILLMLGMATALAAANKRFTLVIDAGHGGHDAGAVGAITKEKYINLNVALAFGRLVEKNCPDVKVIYTRKTDVFVPLHTRADIATTHTADLCVSIHTNALPKGRISRGMETYTLGMHRAADNLAVAKRENEVILYEKDYKQRYQGFDPNSSESYIMFEFIQDHNMAQSVELAKYVQRRACAAAGRQNKGVKQAGFLVLRETSMPSCLIELGFISTSDEERFLASESGVSQLGQGIYQAFLDYKNKFAPSNSTPYKAEPQQQEVDIPAVVPQNAEKKESRKERKRREKKERELKEEQEQQAKQEQQALQQVKAPKPDSIQVQPVEAKPEAAPAPVQTVAAPAPVQTPLSAKPVFKVQIMASSTRVKASSPRLQGEQADCYEEGGMFKYTVGASTNYNEINKLRQQLSAKFPQCFVIAFKDGQKMDVRQAIQEFKKNR